MPPSGRYSGHQYSAYSPDMYAELALRRCYSGEGVNADGTVDDDVLWCNTCNGQNEFCPNWCSAYGYCGTGYAYQYINCAAMPRVNVDYRCALRVQAYTNWEDSFLGEYPIFGSGDDDSVILTPDGFWRSAASTDTSSMWAVCQGACPPSTPPPASPPLPPSVPCQDIVVTLWSSEATWTNLEVMLDGEVADLSSNEGSRQATFSLCTPLALRRHVCRDTLPLRRAGAYLLACVRRRRSRARLLRLLDPGHTCARAALLVRHRAARREAAAAGAGRA